MSTESFTLTAVFNTTPEQLYTDWLSGDGHSQMTGGKATSSMEVGGAHTAWDGYIEGVNLELEPNQRIVQSWKTAEFSPNDEHSQIEILLEAENDGVKMTLTHSNIPCGDGGKYMQGWADHYFEPMEAYYS